jgi:cytochrome c-type biogenesis protein CcmH
MTVFLILAVLMTAGALLFVLLPLTRKEAVAHPHALRDEVNLMVLRDQLAELDADLDAGVIGAAAYQNARQELERRVVEDVRGDAAAAPAAPDKRLMAWVVGLALPLLAAGIYYLVGAPAGLDPSQAVAPKNGAHEITAEQIESMVSALATRLESQPNDVEGWNMLARSYNALGRFEQAADAYSHLIKLAAPTADTLADYADTLAMAQGKSLQGEPEQLARRALKENPKHVKALALAGSAAYERKDYPAAIGYWKRVLELVPAESDFARSTSNSIAEAQKLSGEPGLAEPAPAAAAEPAAAPAAAGATVSGRVELAPALRAKVADTDTVFIYARAEKGPRFPLAVLRKQVKDLPAAFVLDDSMSMVPNARLSGFPSVIVGARISNSGSATAAPGDLEGATQPVRPGAANLKIVIDTQRQ